MTDLVVEGAAAIVPAWDEPALPGAWVAVSGGRVEAIGRGPAPAADRRLDARGGLVLPGAVSAHHHLFQGSSRGVAVEGDLLGWLAVHYRAWARLTEADVEAAATLSLSLLALGGGTTVAAFEYLHPPDADFVAPVLRAAERVGLRLVLVRGCAPRLEGALAERLGADGVDLARLVEPEDVALRRTGEVLGRPATDRVRWACGPTTPVVDDDGAFHRELARVADAHGAPMHTHFHPIPGTTRDGETPFEMAQRVGLVRRGTWFAHGSRLSTTDVARFGEAGVGVVHAPSCAVLLGYPIVPLAAWRATGAEVGVTVDGGASNDRGNPLLEGQLAWQLGRAVHGPAASPSARGILELMTASPARMLGWPELGRLAPGSPADLAVVDLASLELAGVPSAAAASGTGGDPVDALFRTYAGGRVRHLVVGERVVVEDGRLAGLDEAAVATSATASADRLYGRGA